MLLMAAASVAGPKHPGRTAGAVRWHGRQGGTVNLGTSKPLAHPKARLEAITSRPKLLAAVGKMTSHGGQKKILLTITHEAAAQIKRLVANVHAGLRHVMETALQLDKPQRWFALVRYIVEKILTCQPAASPVQAAAASG